ncbi:MAG: EAL domain-containing protein [Lysobacterales bacterium]
MSTQRDVGLTLGGCDERLADMRSIVKRFGGMYDAALSVIQFPVGTDKGFETAAALRDFIQTHWEECLPSLRACWLDSDKPVSEQLSKLVAAQPLSEWMSQGESPLKEILEQRRIDTWFQPIFVRNRLEVWGYECLARARDSGGKIISPADLFRWARQENLIFMLDRICREQHIANCARVNHNPEINFLINFLPSVIYDPQVCLKTTFTVAKRVGVRPEQIIFEVVETERVSDHAHLRSILDEYRNAGFRVALDDLGSGHAGLSLLGDLSPDLIKIDRGMVSKAVGSPIHEAICQSIVEIGRSAGKLVLAEGVETKAEYQLFHRLGADLFQGFLFGKPHPVPRVDRYQEIADRPRQPSETFATAPSVPSATANPVG